MTSTVKILGIIGGLGVVVMIGIIAYGEITKPIGTDILQRPTEQWSVGNSLTENTVLTYRFSHVDNDYVELKTILKFFEKQEQNWPVHIIIEDPIGNMNEQELFLSQSMIPITPIEPHMKSYMRMIQDSILWIVNYAVEPKYLIDNAVWGTMIHGVQKEELKITAREDIVTKAGTFDSYVLSYKIKNKENMIWIVKDKPLPVKAEVYDIYGKLQFKFELVKN